MSRGLLHAFASSDGSGYMEGLSSRTSDPLSSDRRIEFATIFHIFDRAKKEKCSIKEESISRQTRGVTVLRLALPRGIDELSRLVV